MAVYAGPIIDAHHHLWQFAPGRHPWLEQNGRTALCRDVGQEDYAETFHAFPIVGTVWIEALAADPFAELDSAEAERIASRERIATALIGHQPLDAIDICDRLDRLAARRPALRGIRDIVAAEPGKASFARRPDLLEQPGFRDGLAALAERRLVFDLMLCPAQMAAAARLLATLPDLTVAIEHVASPHDPSPAAMALWRDGLVQLAALPGVVMKVSALQCLDPDWTNDSLHRYLDPITEIFGPSRMCMGTDFPVHDLSCPGHEAIATFLHLTCDWTVAEQKAFFHDTAVRTYRLKI
jgi:L-fuconolactonase